ncbi:MAG: hypothetical protein H7Y10_03425 [Flavobacterium sp.]|nr:hypothetical protein [Flavobacterium sp.]
MKNKNQEEELNVKNIRNFLKTFEQSVYKIECQNISKEMTFTPYIGFRIYLNGKDIFTTKSSKIAIEEFNKIKKP